MKKIFTIFLLILMAFVQLCAQNCTIEDVSIEATSTCLGNNLILTVTSNESNLTYLWSYGTTGSTLKVPEARIYTVRVTNLSGCTASATIDIKAGPKVGLSSDGIISCTNEHVQLKVSDVFNSGESLKSLSYAWSTGGTESIIIVSDGGEYSVTVTDNDSHCSSLLTVPVRKDIAVPTIGIPTVDLIDCTTQTQTISVNHTVTNSAGVTYAWSTGGTGSTTAVSEGGSYNVTVTDNANQCSSSATVSVTKEATVPTVTVPSVAEINCNETAQTLTAYYIAAHPVSYRWSNGGNRSTITVTDGGIYRVTATDNDNHCSSSTTVSVTDEKEEITPIIIGETEFKTTYKDITLSVIGVPDDSRYKWSDNSTLSEMIVTSSGEYSVVVSYGSCSGSATIYISEQTHAWLTISPSEKNAGTFDGPGFYEIGEKVLVQANPAPYYRFVKWSDGSTQNPRRITMTGDITLTAYFVDELAEESFVNPGQVLVEPDSTNAMFSWPQTEGSNSYSLEIKKDGVVFCTLEFNEYGQLAGIDFTTRAMTKGFQFKVTGLEEDSDYRFSLKAKDASENVIASYAGDFSTRAGAGSSIGESNLGNEDEEPGGSAGEGTAVSENANNILAYGLNMQVIVKGAFAQTISVYNVVGQLLETRVASSDTEIFNVYPEGVYIVNVGEEIYKVVVK